MFDSMKDHPILVCVATSIVTLLILEGPVRLVLLVLEGPVRLFQLACNLHDLLVGRVHQPTKLPSTDPLAFRSHAEYKAAQVEMDLNEFLARASQTPEHLKRATDLAGSGGCGAFAKANEENTKKALQLDTTTTFSTDPRGFIPIDQANVRIGFWLRNIETKKLVKVLNDPMHHLVVHDGYGEVEVEKFWYQLALPMKGECWHFSRCPGHSLGDSVVTFSSDPFVSEMVVCGCLSPVNFGKGA